MCSSCPEVIIKLKNNYFKSKIKDKAVQMINTSM